MDLDWVHFVQQGSPVLLSIGLGWHFRRFGTDSMVRWTLLTILGAALTGFVMLQAGAADNAPQSLQTLVKMHAE